MKQKVKQFIREVGVMSVSVSFAFIITAVFIVAGIYVAKGWTEPTGIPPAGNLGAPINTSDKPQNKAGALGVSGVLSVVSAITTDGTIDAKKDICTENGGDKVCLSVLGASTGGGGITGGCRCQHSSNTIDNGLNWGKGCKPEGEDCGPPSCMSAAMPGYSCGVSYSDPAGHSFAYCICIKD